MRANPSIDERTSFGKLRLPPAAAYVELALERARYEAKRAQRQFDAVEPENRLVAAELEGRWNGALAQVAELEGRLPENFKIDVALIVQGRFSDAR